MQYFYGELLYVGNEGNLSRKQGSVIKSRGPMYTITEQA